MYQTLIILGIVCILAAAVGGGLTAFGVIVPPLSSAPRVVSVVVIGGVLIGVGIKIRPVPPPPGPTGISITTDAIGQRTAASCPANLTVTGSITTTGGDGSIEYRLRLISDSGATIYSPLGTVSAQGAGTYPINDTFLFHGNSGGDFTFEVVSPVSDGSPPQAFSLSC